MFDDIDLVIFDLDGTLVKTEPLHKEAYKLAESWILERCPERLSESYLYEMKCTFYLGLLSSSILEVNAPVHEIYKSLQQTDKKLVLATSTTSNNARLIIEKLDLSFDLVLTGDQFEENNKPAPDMFLAACEHFKIGVYNTIVIEDSENGFMAAKLANISYLDANNIECQTLL